MPKRSFIRWSVFIVMLAGGILLLGRAGTFLEKPDPVIKSDVLVALMGSMPDVVLHTSDLYNKGIAPKVLIGRTTTARWEPLIARGIQPPALGAEQFKQIAVQLGVPAEDVVILPGNNESTFEEAVVIRAYVLKHPQTDTITIVCSESHSRRAGMIFRKAFRKAGLKVHLMVSPSPYSGYDGKKWWADREKVQTVVYEWIKIVSFVVVEQWKL